jgi:hypothetical protein
LLNSLRILGLNHEATIKACRLLRRATRAYFNSFEHLVVLNWSCVI